MKAIFLKRMWTTQIRRNVAYFVLLLGALSIGIFLGFLVLQAPAPYDSSDETAFSVDRMRNTIGEIAKQPHPVHSKENEEVRKYICNQLASLGLAPIYPDTEERYVVTTDGLKNIAAKLDGESDNAILLVAHYDSARTSYGAADDGYGVATILETLRAIRAQEVPLQNDIVVLFTDGEEKWMSGVKAELKSNLDRYQNVFLVLNVEASGTKGPVVMFETGNKNADIIDYYAKHAKNPVAFSFTTAYYNFMPNDTDFAIFKNYGFNGLNFAVIDGAEYHHTLGDSLENIDLRSLQHYGDQVFSIVKSFVSDSSLSRGQFESNTNKVFFSIVPGLLVSYSEAVSEMLAVAAAALFIVLTVIGCAQYGIKPIKVLLYSVLLISIVMFLALASESIACLFAFISGMKFQLVRMYIPHDGLIYLLVNVTAVVTMGIFCWSIAKRSKGPELIFASILLDLILSALLSVFLTGAAYIVILPALLASLYVASSHLIKSKVLKTIVLAITALLDMMIYVPVVILIYQSLSIGIMGAGVLLCLLPFTTILPMFYEGLSKEERISCGTIISKKQDRTKILKKTIGIVLAVFLMSILLYEGLRQEGAPGIFTTGIPMKDIKDGKVTMQTSWEGRLSALCDKVIIKASDEQVDQLQEDGNHLVVRFLDQGTYFDNVTVESITRLKDEKSDYRNEVVMNLNTDEKVETSGDIEVLLQKTVTITSDSDEVIVKIEQ